ncbi:MAG: hypothetical protein NVS9B15_11380 [Acidobacteriaceae bacterium]
MEVSGKQKFGIITLVLVVLILIRVGLIWKANHEAADAKPAANTAVAVPADAYVAPPKLHAYDLASAKQGLEGKTIWVAAGDQLEFYPVSGSTVDWKHAKGKLPPLDALKVQKVVKVPGGVQLIKQGNVTFHKEGTPRVAAIFTHAADAKPYGVEIGTVDHDSYSFIVDDVFYLSDPHQLYKHWTPEVWKAIDEHRAVKGMNELQTSMALGPGRSDSTSAYGNRTMQYERGGKTVSVTFASDKATSISEQ